MTKLIKMFVIVDNNKIQIVRNPGKKISVAHIRPGILKAK